MKSGVNSIVVADANVLLSAIAGRAAGRVFESGIEIYTTEYTWSEVEKYLSQMSQHFGIPFEELITSSNRAPVLVIAPQVYATKLEKAKKWMMQKDPDDVELAALALHMEVPVWSNDNHFKNFPTKRYTTAELLKILGY